MKYILALILCSQTEQICMPPHQWPELFNSQYDCMVFGYEESLKKIHSRVVKWKKILSQENLYVQGIGEFILNDSENIIFTADKNLNFLKESFGLSPIKVQMLEKSVLTYDKKTLEKYNSLTIKKKSSSFPAPLRNAAIFILL